MHIILFTHNHFPSTRWVTLCPSQFASVDLDVLQGSQDVHQPSYITWDIIIFCTTLHWPLRFMAKVINTRNIICKARHFLCMYTIYTHLYTDKWSIQRKHLMALVYDFESIYVSSKWLYTMFSDNCNGCACHLICISSEKLLLCFLNNPIMLVS